MSGSDDEPKFEDALTKLEDVIETLEEGDLSLDEALQNYELGVKLIQSCHRVLQHAERRVDLLSGIDENGQPICTPIEITPTHDPD